MLDLRTNFKLTAKKHELTDFLICLIKRGIITQTRQF